MGVEEKRRNRVGSNMILPEDCVCEILSLTSPVDALRSCLVCSCFRSAAESDLVWERFLPPDYEEIVQRSSVPLNFSSKKQLFLSLCDPLLLDDGGKINPSIEQSFKLERQSGKKWYMLSARELSITWANNPIYWKWVSTTESRFSEAIVLRASNWLEIRCKIRTRMLTRSTMYGAFMILKKTRTTYGLELLPAETSVEVRNQTWRGMVDLSEELTERGDGWTEVEVGEFFTGEDDAEVRLNLTEVKGDHLKGGLVVEGMEFRPKLDEDASASSN